MRAHSFDAMRFGMNLPKTFTIFTMSLWHSFRYLTATTLEMLVNERCRGDGAKCRTVQAPLRASADERASAQQVGEARPIALDVISATHWDLIASCEARGRDVVVLRDVTCAKGRRVNVCEGRTREGSLASECPEEAVPGEPGISSSSDPRNTADEEEEPTTASPSPLSEPTWAGLSFEDDYCWSAEGPCPGESAESLSDDSSVSEEDEAVEMSWSVLSEAISAGLSFEDDYCWSAEGSCPLDIGLVIPITDNVGNYAEDLGDLRFVLLQGESFDVPSRL